MAKLTPQVVQTTVGAVRSGVHLCFENARRFIRNARILLDHKGSDGLAYVLWSFAVEEFGKAQLLLDQASGEDSTPVNCSISMNHREKFKRGLASITGLTTQIFQVLLRVSTNTRETDAEILNSFVGVDTLSVQSGMTGAFSDTAGDSQLEGTVPLRLDLLYVNWRTDQQRFGRPGEAIAQRGLSGRWELDHDDLSEALEAVDAELFRCDTKFQKR